MIRSLRSTVFLSAMFLLPGFLAPAMGQQEQPREEGKKEQPKLRLICISALQPDHEVVLAARDDKGEWTQLGKTGLRSSFISDWLPSNPGELHLTVPGSDGPRSICSFKHPTSARHALVLLIADPAKKAYRAVVLDPAKMNFAKGSVLAVNFSTQPGLLVFGTKKIKLESGGKTVLKPALEENGMYRMLVAYEDAEKKIVPCYDRYLQGNADSRDLLFLIPDPTLGFKVFSLPMFGELD
jgi:hypothetical protein